jgi:hypothetical protein
MTPLSKDRVRFLCLIQGITANSRGSRPNTYFWTEEDILLLNYEEFFISEMAVGDIIEYLIRQLNPRRSPCHWKGSPDCERVSFCLLSQTETNLYEKVDCLDFSENLTLHTKSMGISDNLWQVYGSFRLKRALLPLLWWIEWWVFDNPLNLEIW